MKFTVLSLLIGMMTCFLDGPFIVIWMHGFGLGPPLMIFWIWLIFLASIAENVSLILMISAVIEVGLEACA